MKNTANTRIFTFGVGDDVNAVLLDQLADKTRSVSTYVRESEDIEAKVSSLYGKISHPVLTNLKLKVGGDITLAEVYPPQLPDLFHGTQLVVLGRYRGHGHAAVTLTGTTGKDSKEFVYEVKFPAKTNADKAFVEDLWARRKVGYLLDQIRTDGENAEVKTEVVRLAKKYGITTPYTSYLVVPDGPTTRVTGMPAAPQAGMAPTDYYSTAQVPTVTDGVSRNHGYQITNGASASPFGDIVTGATAAPPVGSGQRIQYAPVTVSPNMQWATPMPSPSSAPMSGSYFEQPLRSAEYDRLFPDQGRSLRTTGSPSGAQLEKMATRRARWFTDSLDDAEDPGECVGSPSVTSQAMNQPTRDQPAEREEEEEAESTPGKDSAAQKKVYDQVRAALQSRAAADVQSGKLGVDLSLRLSDLRNQSQLGRATTKQAAGRTCVKFRGAWVDEGFDAKMQALTVKAMSAAYFRILERQPQMREVFQMGNRVLWVTPCGAALVVDPGDGREEMTDAEIDALFVATK